jgi:beta-lactam-binding protein with PASTA domain/serine/threonine protein kinase
MSPEMEADTIVDGRYKVLSRLGTGGMADVFLAEDLQLGRKVALKLLHRRFAEDPGFVERFRREAQAAAGLQHPNVVSVYDRGSYDDTYYIAMEYLSGRTLKQLIRDDAPLDPIRAIDITIQILKAARFAHRRGVIHRDLKPHNVIVDDQDHAKVTDFGIARAGASDMTETGSIMGTAQYLSPEQAQGLAVSESSDLYSIAVVLYEMLTGRVPFDADAAVTIALKHVSEAPPAVSSINPTVPPELEQVVMWALNKNPADRPKDADEFVAALEQAKAAIVSGGSGQRTASIAALSAAAAGSAPIRATDYLPPQADPWPVAPLVPVVDGHNDEPPDDERQSNPWPWIALLVALLLAGGGVTAYLLTRPTKAVVPKVVLDQVSTARALVQNAGFTVSLDYQTDTHALGVVIDQSPLGGAKANAGSTVTLVVSQGPGDGTVPAVVGEPIAQAEKDIEKSKLKVGRIVFQSSSAIAAGQVISTSPSAGSTPPVGTKVEITVSTGPAKVAIPNVVGQSVSSAKANLQAAGFKNITTSDQVSSTVKPGNVISMTPGAGTKVVAGTVITLTVAKAPPTAKVPDVTGKTGADAESALGAAGFNVVETTQTVTHQAKNGVVIKQTPAGGRTEPKQSTVTIVIGQYVPPSTTTTTSSTTTNTSSTTTTTTTSSHT